MKKTRRSKSGLLNQPFRFQPGLVLGVLGLAFLGGGVMLNAGATNSTTVSACKPVAVRDINSANPSANQVAYTVNSAGQGGLTTAYLKAGANCVGPLVSLVTYKTTSYNGLPRNKQTLFDSQTKPLAASVITMSVHVPDCYYQTDLVYGLPLDLTKGIDYSGSTNFIWGVTGGTRACTMATPAPSTTVSPLASATPRPTVSVLPVSPSPSATATPAVTATPAATETATPKASSTPTPGSGGNTPAPTATPEVIILGPGESTPPPAPVTSVLPFLPQTGQAGSFMTFLGALLVTAGLFHIYLTQRQKLIKPAKLR